MASWSPPALAGDGRRELVTRRAVLLSLLLAIAGCSAKQPVLYPNDHLRRVGPEAARADVAACRELAAAHVGSEPAADAAKDTATGAVVGGATGAAVGGVLGHPGSGAGAGAAGGATRGFLRWLLRRDEPDAIARAFVERCLRERGYEPLGWD